MAERDLLAEEEDLLASEKPSIAEKAVRGVTTAATLGLAEPKKVERFAREAISKPSDLFELPIAEFGRGMVLGGKQAGAAAMQFSPSKREQATRIAQETEEELATSGAKRAGAITSDILGIGKLFKLAKVPEFIQAGKTAAGRIGRAGAVGGATTAAITPALEPGDDFLGQKIKQGAIGFGFSAIPSAGIEVAQKFVFPGSRLTANEATIKLIDEARSRGYTIPISEMTKSAMVNTLDRIFDNPLVERNAPIFARTINRLMGESAEEISPTVFNRITTRLSGEIQGLVRGKTIDVAGKMAQEDRKSIEGLLKKIDDQITGQNWHDLRRELNRVYVSALSRNLPEARNYRMLIDKWDDAAANSVPDKAWQGKFADWKGKQTVAFDVEEAVLSNSTARDNFTKGILDPVDLRNTIASKRPTEFTRRLYEAPSASRTTPGGREQTTEAGVAGALNIYGREAPTAIAPYYRATTAPKFVGTLLGAKKLQEGLYSPRGQELLLEGLRPQQLRSLQQLTQPFAVESARSVSE